MRAARNRNVAVTNKTNISLGAFGYSLYMAAATIYASRGDLQSVRGVLAEGVNRQLCARLQLSPCFIRKHNLNALNLPVPAFPLVLSDRSKNVSHQNSTSRLCRQSGGRKW
jgi:hypothetical protein